MEKILTKILFFKREEISASLYKYSALSIMVLRYVINQEPLKLPGQMTCSKNFKTPFFSRHQKFLPWGNSNRSKTSPKFFYFNIYGR